MASSYESLPLLTSFLANNFSTLSSYDHLDDCSICHEPFAPFHEPAQINAPTCSHIFGRDCLQAWLSTSMTCPMCRTTLYKKDTSTIDISEIAIRPIAAQFVQYLWKLLWTGSNDNPNIMDLGAATRIFLLKVWTLRALEFASDVACDLFELDCELIVRNEHSPLVLALVLDMYIAHQANGEYKEYDDELEEKWMTRMGEALGWCW